MLVLCWYGIQALTPPKKRAENEFTTNQDSSSPGGNPSAQRRLLSARVTCARGCLDLFDGEVVFMPGYVRLHRDWLNDSIWQDADLFRVWTWCLLKAAPCDQITSMKIGRGETDISVKTGEFATGQNVGAKELGMKPRTFYNKLCCLAKCNRVCIKSANHYSIVSIVGYSEMQSNDSYDVARQVANQVANQVATQSKPKKVVVDELSERFKAFWEAYPKKVGKKQAWQAWKSSGAESCSLYEPLLKYISITWKDKELQYIPNPSSWLNQRRWEEEPIDPTAKVTDPEEEARRRALQAKYEEPIVVEKHVPYTGTVIHPDDLLKERNNG